MIGEIGVLIPIVALTIPIVAIWTKHSARWPRCRCDHRRAVAEKAAQYASHSRELEDRVRVLERIVTDKGYDVATQIEALRDARDVDKRMVAHADRDRVQ